MQLISRFLIRLTSDFIGEDDYGHRYYISKYNGTFNRRKRYVVYNGLSEPSKVPPMWHAWLHYLSNDVPLRGRVKNYKWQKDHIPNLTGTVFAYNPAIQSGCVVKKSESTVYKAWQP